jgi:ribonuclease-3
MDSIEKEEESELESLEERLGYCFRNRNLLRQALTHASYAHEHLDQCLGDNERLEFLGDAILNSAVTHLLVERFSDGAEGELTLMRGLLVSRDALAPVAKGFNLGQSLRLGKGELRTGGREKASILANTYEAVVGAVYLDGGYERAIHMVRSHFTKRLKEVGDRISRHSFKNLLQERIQNWYHTVPRYTVVKESGPDHHKRFQVSVSVRGRNLGRGEGKTRKEAEQRAAEEALERTKEDAR